MKYSSADMSLYLPPGRRAFINLLEINALQIFFRPVEFHARIVTHPRSWTKRVNIVCLLKNVVCLLKGDTDREEVLDGRSGITIEQGFLPSLQIRE